MPEQPGASITVSAAARRLGVSPRHVRRLAGWGELVAVGEGNARRVTVESIARYENKGGPRADITAQMSAHSGYKFTVEQILKSVPALSLPRSAAKILGISQGHFAGMVESGAVPTIAIGNERFVPGLWLSETLARAYGVTTK